MHQQEPSTQKNWSPWLLNSTSAGVTSTFSTLFCLPEANHSAEQVVQCKATPVTAREAAKESRDVRFPPRGVMRPQKRQRRGADGLEVVIRRPQEIALQKRLEP